MQVTFHAGLEALDEKMRRRKEELSGAVKETVWEKRLREKAEKRGRLNAKKKKNDALDDPTGTNEPKIRGSDDVDADRRGSSTPSGFDDPFFADGGDDVDFDAVASDDDDVIGERKTTREKDAFVTKETKKASKRHLNKRLADDDPRVAKERADLELLMMDDDAVLGDFGATTRAKPVDARNVDTSTLGTLGETRTSSAVSKKKSRKARLAEKKKTRGKDARRRESDDEDDDGAPYGQSSKTSQQKVDVADDRFAGLFESEKFALDPTDPRFRETKAAEFIAEERARRRGEKSRATLLEKKKARRENGDARKKREKNGDEEDASGAGDVALRAMVKGLKRKSEAAARASGGSKRR